MSEHLNGENDPIEPIEEPPQTCNQCQMVPDQYISLKCSHNLCLQCLAQIYKDLSNNSPEPNFQIICPFDQIETFLDEFSIAALQKTIESTQTQETQAEYQEEVHHSENENPLLNSPEEEKFEENHVDKPKSISKEETDEYNEYRFKERKDMDFEPNNKNNEENENIKGSIDCFKFCSKHRKETASLYCFSCESELLCVQCLVDGFHDQHEVKNLRKNPEVVKRKFDDLMEKMQGLKQSLFQFISELGSKQKIISHKVFEAKTQIVNDFKELREKLNHKEKELLQKTEEHSQEKLQEIAEEMANFKEKYQRLNFLADKNKASLNQKDDALETILKTYKLLQEDMEKIHIPSKNIDEFNDFKCYLNMDSFYKYLENIQILKLEITGVSNNRKKIITPFNFPKTTTKSYLLHNNNSFIDGNENGAGLMDFDNNEIKWKTSYTHEKNKFHGNFMEKKPYLFLKSGYDHINSQMVGKRSSVAMNRSTNSFLQGYGISDVLKDVNRSSLIFMKKMKEASNKTQIEDRPFNRSRMNISGERQRLMNSLEKQKSLFEKNKNVF
jgi:cytochrome c556